MSELSSLVHRVLVEAHVILKEVTMIMDNKSGDIGTRHNVEAAYNAIDKLVENPEDLAIVSEDLDYQNLIAKLQIKANPLDLERLKNAKSRLTE